MKKLLLLLFLVFLSTNSYAVKYVVVEGWNPDYLAFKLIQWHKKHVDVRLIKLPGIGKTLEFK